MTDRNFKVTDMLPVQQGESERGPWRSQDIIVESTENVQYPDRLLLRFSGNAVDMLAEVKVIAPHLFTLAGPACVAGPCPEGKMSCGKAAEMREKFR